MRLLEPYFLYAFLALAIPILIHLFSLQRHKTIYFSNVSFLKQLNQKKRTFSKLQNLLLLLLRLLLLSAIILAFCEPYVSKDNLQVNDEKLIGIYIDNSFSMDAKNDKGTLIELAKNKARSVLNAHKSDDDFIFINNDLEGKYQRVVDFENCLDAIDNTEITPNFLTFNQVLNNWNTLKQNQRNKEGVLFVISDFQKTSFNHNFHLYDSISKINLLPIESYRQANLSIDTCYLESPNHIIGQQEWLTFRVKNASHSPIENLVVKLYINGVQKALSTLNVEATSSTIAKLNFTNHALGSQKAYIELTDGVIPFDNRMYFNFDVKEATKILGIYQNNSLTEINNLFSDEVFDYHSQEIGNLTVGNFDEYNLIILQNLNQISSGLILSLKNFVEKGGNLCIIPSMKQNKEHYLNLLGTLNIPGYLNIVEQDVKVSSLNSNHRLFKDVFESHSEKIDLPKSEVYFNIEKKYNSSHENVMMLNTKDAFINSYNYGNGAVYQLCAPLTKTNLPKHALFVPILYNMALQSSKFEEIYYTIGKDNHLIVNNIEGNQNYKLTKGSQFELLPEVRSIAQNIQIHINNLLFEDGHYDLISPKSNHIFSFNYDRKESNLLTWDLEYLQSIDERYPHVKLWNDEGLKLEQNIKEKRSGNPIWHYFIYSALFFLFVESMLIKNWKNKTKLNVENKSS